MDDCIFVEEWLKEFCHEPWWDKEAYKNLKYFNNNVISAKTKFN